MYSMLRRLVRRYQSAGVLGVARSVGRRVGISAPDVHPIHHVLRRLARQQQVSLVQIGAFIGKTENDPLYAFLSAPRRPGQTIRAILVEPVKQYFDQLQQNYEKVPGVVCENVAVADHEGVVDFYRLGVNPEEHGYPAWLAQLGSIKSERTGTLWEACEANPDYQAFLLEHRLIEQVPAVTFHTLLERNGLTDLDLLQIDAEGYDYDIIRSIDFTRISPKYINYESSLLGENAQVCRNLLARAGYGRFRDHGGDTLAVFRAR